jgi:hypothetical protein
MPSRIMESIRNCRTCVKIEDCCVNSKKCGVAANTQPLGYVIMINTSIGMKVGSTRV